MCVSKAPLVCISHLKKLVSRDASFKIGCTQCNTCEIYINISEERKLNSVG